MANRNYGNDKIAASWLDLNDIREGCVGDGDWFTDSGRENPAFVSTADRAGNTTQSYDNRRQGGFTLNVLRSSQLFTQLQTIHRNDRISRNQVGNFTVTDLNKNEKYVYVNARISTMPPLTFGPEVQAVPFEFIYERLDVPQSVVDNIIGA